MIKETFKEVQLEQAELEKQIGAYLDSISKKSSATVVTYRKALFEFSEFCRRGTFRFTVDDVVKYKRYLEYKKKMKKYSISTYLTALRRFCHFLSSENIIEKNPARRVNYKIKDRVVKFDFLNKEQLIKLFKELPKVSEQDYRDRAILHLIVYAGLEEGKIPEIEFQDFRQVKKKHYLSVKLDKGKYNDIELKTDTADAIIAYIKSRGVAFSSEPLFLSLSNRSGKQAITKRGVREIILNRLKSTLSEEQDIKLTPHTLTHTAAVLMKSKGIKIEEISAKIGIKSAVTLQKITEAGSKY
jgi:site-specific recombinase XerD